MCSADSASPAPRDLILLLPPGPLTGPHFSLIKGHTNIIPMASSLNFFPKAWDQVGELFKKLECALPNIVDSSKSTPLLTCVSR